MHIIAKKIVENFWLKHPNAKAPLESWYKLAAKSDFTNFSELRKTFNSADYVAPFVVFDIGGNNFRIVASVHFNRQKLYIREVMTHSEYDRWNLAYRIRKQ